MAKLQSLSINDSEVTDYVVGGGVSDGWTYRKWNSGIIDLYYNKSFDLVIDTEVGSFWQGTYTFTLPFSLPVILATNATQNDDCCWVGQVAVSSSDQVTVRLFRTSKFVGGATVFINLYIVGKYK